MNPLRMQNGQNAYIMDPVLTFVISVTYSRYSGRASGNGQTYQNKKK